jgi:serine/threonine-protein kinase
MPVSIEPFSLPERYRLERGIAAGGMAAVYAAHDTVLNRPVAVKVLADHLNDDPVARQRFQREARAAAGLSSHPGVVTIFDVGEHRGRSFLVMERRDGGTLADAGRVSAERALAWLHTVAEAVDAAHAQGVVHRDIKPANLLLDDHDRVAVADFGIASLATETERFTQTGQVLGTASYLSPEQAAGEPATAASDRYALAVVAYELLTGAKPFSSEHFAAQARAHIEDTPPPAPGLAPEAQQVLARGLAKDPQARWPSAVAFVDALARAMGGGAAPPPPATAATRPLPGRPPDRRSRVPLVLAGALILAILAAIGFAAATDNEGSGGDARPKQATKPKAQKKEKAKAETTPEPTVAATEPPATTPAPDTGGGDPAALNAQGFELLQAGDYAGAVAPLSDAVDACDGQGPLDPCGYAYYNLGVALLRTGRTDEALQVLQARMDIWGDNSAGDVQQAIDEASGGSTQSTEPEKPGKAKGHFK